MNSTPQCYFDHDEALEKLPREAKAKLQHYVYQYVDPRTDEPFYVGKGCGDRVRSHLSAAGESQKALKLAALREAGVKPTLLIVRHGMTESEAFAVESVLIEQFGLYNLTDKVAVRQPAGLGCMSLDQIRSAYSAEPVTSFDHPSLLIRLPHELNGSIKPYWSYLKTHAVLGALVKTETEVKLIMAVHDGVVKEVYEVDGKTSWNRGGTRQSITKDRDEPGPTCWNFEGPVCNDTEIRKLYHLKGVNNYFAKDSQNPICYVWPTSYA